MSSVSCPCQHNNPADAKFCNQCGQPLRLKPCARCDAINYVGARKCDHCGADFNEPNAGTFESAPSVSAISSEPRSARVAHTGARFSFENMNTVNADHSNPSILAGATLPSDAAAAANVDFLIFPTPQAGSCDSDGPDDPAVLALASDATGAANVDFLIFPTHQTGNAETERQENHSSSPSAERRDPHWREAWDSAPFTQTDPFAVRDWRQ